MKKIEFQNYPSTETPLNAENLNQMQDNIETSINEETSRSKIKTTSLFGNIPSAGETGILSAIESSYTISGHKWSDFDFLVIEVSTRVWGYAKKHELIFDTHSLNKPNMGANNLFTTIAPHYGYSTVFTIQYYFTNDDTITIFYNSHPDGDNHIYIRSIYGVKIK